MLSMISELFIRLNERDKSIAAMTKAAKLDPKYYLLLTQLASGDPKYTAVAEDSLQKATRFFTDKLEKDPLDAATRLMLADTFRMKNDLEGAQRVIVEGMRQADNPICGRPFRSLLSDVYQVVQVYG